MTDRRRQAAAWYLRDGLGMACDDIDLDQAATLLEVALRDLPAELTGLPAPGAPPTPDNPLFDADPEDFAAVLARCRRAAGVPGGDGGEA